MCTTGPREKATSEEGILNRFIVLFLTLLGCASAGATEPQSVADLSWIPGNYGPPDSPFATKYFTPEVRLDTAYHYQFHRPVDHSLSGSSQAFRHHELQITQIGVGGDFLYEDVGIRVMTQFGLYSSMTPQSDSSSTRGQGRLDNAYRYISEAYATYKIHALEGINLQAGIFMSYVGLWSYYNFDNWTYQPSYVSSFTPWFFNGIRAQIFVNDRLKIEPWLINGWQSYGMFNEQPGMGLQILYRPTPWISLLGNQYYGADTLNTAGRQRIHSDNSVMVRYRNQPSSFLSKAAASLTMDLGCEQGGGVNCGGQYVMGFMIYNRLWFDHDRYAITMGGGALRNPGRYLVLTPPINGATAGSPVANPAWWSANAGDDFQAWDLQLTADYMPTRNVTFRLEYNHRESNVPYFAGSGGMTPYNFANGTRANTGAPGSDPGTGWNPDLRRSEDRVTAAFLVCL